MALELDRVQKPLRELRKALKQLSDDPAPEAVHKLRTRARRMEVLVAALTRLGKKKTRRLLKSIKQVRKAAGAVRDMDVLAGHALSLSQESGNGSLTRLVEHLRMSRRKSAGALLDAIGRPGKTARHNLKQFNRQIQSAAAKKKIESSNGYRHEAAGQHVRAVAAELIRELSRWPAFSLANLHLFRLKVKELRYILQLAPDPDTGFGAALGRVKDQIGEWHDWQQLAEVAAGFLGPRQDRALLTQIGRIGKQKLRQALAASNALRKRYLKPLSAAT